MMGEPTKQGSFGASGPPPFFVQVAVFYFLPPTFFKNPEPWRGFGGYFYFHFEIYKFLQPCFHCGSWVIWLNLASCHVFPQLWGLGLGDVKPWSSWTKCFSNDMEFSTEGSLNFLKVDITMLQICFFPGWFSIAQDGFLHLFQIANASGTNTTDPLWYIVFSFLYFVVISDCWGARMIRDCRGLGYPTAKPLDSPDQWKRSIGLDAGRYLLAKIPSNAVSSHMCGMTGPDVAFQSPRNSKSLKDVWDAKWRMC